ncbi:hypothetical protein [Deinococcus soli (ex Cha et al. 2016)]|uniref:Lipoprotein n=2 Tax=Deinococcus soli (ex Cha et al. 2016) TaxID=1309411 RepID=A0AAE4BN90_9DEIO|nr:hypothetical protein [Deinococcus soli (ex Cha et al. 2016)]MDR6218884.1 hypothetical protein [Deinococcus soli (ex Cha et al. 2016)]MDR6328681.1 hypothetical protein [Deinococcus soli (ex Cha et al. 2016)]MDR6751832.1 hypothetical protein [Deinococcus soli (ex Cha et al. 2016)]
MKALLPLTALLLAGCAQVTAPATGAQRASTPATPSHEVLPDGHLRVTGTVNANLTGHTQLRFVRQGVVTFETVGTHAGGTFTADIAPEQITRNTDRVDYIRLQLNTMRGAQCRVNTLTPSAATSGGYWFQYLYVDGANGTYRSAQEWTDAGYRARSTAYVYMDTEESLTGEADCLVATSRGLVRHRLNADLHLTPGWNVIHFESLQPRTEDAINMTVKTGDDPTVPWIRS